MRELDFTSDTSDVATLFQTVERHDCGYLLDFHSHNLFGHTRIGHLGTSQRADLAAKLNEDLKAQNCQTAIAASDKDPDGFARADAFIEPMPIAHVESGLAGDMAQFLFRTWIRNRGVVMPDRELTRLSPWLLLTLPDAPAGDVPHVTFIGNQSSFVKFFPQSIDMDAYRSPADCLPKDYRQGVAEAYHWAFEGEPCFDIQRTGYILGEGLPDMTLQRLLLRFETKTGLARVFSLVTLLEMHSRPFDSNRTDHRRWRQHGLSWHPAYQVSGPPG
ncbi:hypothetical protein [Roseibium sediminicola]|uniref:Uncharacterized protein n=1 Tax=Roseibium sediminicola TaxID=2933272 RepID=A0ABT0GZ11_9HYPH|nr:hypothetical protein [Roseibium sp. CAU 1639]MCK7614676.1 hypothetical protein [Roseibium sp. CAU 1639]